MAVDNDYIQTKEDYDLLAQSIWGHFMEWKSSNDINLIIDDICQELNKRIPDIKILHKKNRINKIVLFILSPFISKNLFQIIVLVLRFCLTKSEKNNYINFREFGLCKDISINDILDFTEIKKQEKTASSANNKFLKKTKIISFIYSYFKHIIKSGNTKLFIENRFIYQFIYSENYFNSVAKFILQIARLKNINVSSEAVFECLFFLKENFVILIDVIPNKEKAGLGFSKMFKVLLGVLFYRIAYIYHKDQSELIIKDAELINLVKTAYYWGLTYPLIDEVIDSDVLTADEKNDYFNLLKAIFSDKNDYSAINLQNKHKFVTYFLDSWNSLKVILPYKDNKKTYITILLALESHIADCQKNNYDEINIILKAGLVRTSTALIAGIPVSDELLKNMFLMSFYNQEEDDMADILEDLESGHSTPFSQFIKNETSKNPFYLFIQYLYYIYHISNDDINVKDLLILNLLEMIKNIKKKKGNYEFLEKNVINLTTNKQLIEKLKLISRFSNGIENVDLEYAFMPFLVDSANFLISKR